MPNWPDGSVMLIGSPTAYSYAFIEPAESGSRKRPRSGAYVREPSCTIGVFSGSVYAPDAACQPMPAVARSSDVLMLVWGAPAMVVPSGL